MDIEVEFALEVVGSEFPETAPVSERRWYRCWCLQCILCFVPGDDGRQPYLPHTGEEGECGEYQRSPDELVIVEEGDDAERLRGQLARRCGETTETEGLLQGMGDEGMRPTFSFDFSLTGACAGAGEVGCADTFLRRSSSALDLAPVV